MNKLVTTLLLFLFPGLLFADSLTFTPPPTDYSVVFLGNLFGVVDGILSGTGSQIMGSMFSVFNAAVLALGGIIIMYTLLVSTMNTAHEGQMLGQKWSSIWIPIRSTVGLALLIPKASGYCLMQIFVMWVVVQGIGAADKIWEAALSYLNRGGVIIQAQQANPAADLAKGGEKGLGGVATGAINILSGQVCMIGLQTKLQNQRKSYLDSLPNSGPCSKASPGDAIDQFCKTVVPDFLGSVNTVIVQNKNPNNASWTVDMPNFDSASPYSYLNGICGTIKWNNISTLSDVLGGINPNASSGNAPVGRAIVNVTTIEVNPVPKLTSSEIQTTQMSRAIAIQQMYMDLSSVARAIVSNDPVMSSTASNGKSKPYNPGVANQQFGVPYTQDGTVCKAYGDNCVIWGPDQGTQGGGVLFNGTELMNAINDYNAIMMPTVNLARIIKDSQNQKNTTSFINKAKTQGWIMAGAYFYDLVKIQGISSIGYSSQTDSETGLQGSIFEPNAITSPFGPVGEDKNSSCVPGGVEGGDKDFSKLCVWFDQKILPMQQLQNLIIDSSPPKKPTPSNEMTVKGGVASSTVYGFINNSLMMRLPGQPGAAPLTFANAINFKASTSLYRLQEQTFECGEVRIIVKICLGQKLGNLIYNKIMVSIYNFFLDIFGSLINQVISAFLIIPLTGMAEIFKQGLQVISAPGVNPIVALANMGNQYINFAGELWLMLLSLAISSSLVPIFGVFIFALMTLAMPLVIAWVGIMVGIGFTTAFYIPILPYMIFTFGALGWLISVIEAMVAAPIVALGVTHPEGHEAFGKGEHAIMILINVFLRPAMMIIGYIAAIALSYVGVWLLNAGYDQAIGFIQGGEAHPAFDAAQISGGMFQSGSGAGTNWAGIYAFFFSILTYTTMYLIIVQKTFTLITYLPDKVLRWIGGSPESLGQEAGQWGEEIKRQGESAGKETQGAQGQIDKSLGAYAQKGIGKVKSAVGLGGGSGDVSAQGESSPKKPPVNK